MSGHDVIVAEAMRWIRFSQEDLIAARVLRSSADSAPRHACWLSQQAIEKALKAALVFEGIRFPFTHDINRLRNLLPESWPVPGTHADLAEITEWAVDIRYPGDWLEPTLDDAARAESLAAMVCESIRSELVRRGLTPN